MGICGFFQRGNSSCTGRFGHGRTIMLGSFLHPLFYHLLSDIISLGFVDLTKFVDAC